MPYVSTKDLFNFVKSLSSSEKRLFKIYISKNPSSKDSGYLRIFDVINQMQSFDVKILLQRIPEIPKKQVSNQKWYLQELLLKSIRSTRKEFSAESKIRELIDEAEILFSKTIFNSSRKKALKAIELSKKNDLFLYHLNCLSLIDRINRAEKKFKIIKNRIDKNFDEEHEILNKYLNWLDFYKISNKLWLFENISGYERNFDIKNELSKIYEELENKKDVSPLSNRAQLILNQFYSTYYYVQGNIKLCNKYLDKVLTYFEHSTKTNPHNILNYITQLRNKMLLCTMEKNEKMFQEILMKMWKIRLNPDVKRNKYLEALVFAHSHLLEFTFYSNEFNYARIMEVVQRISKEIDIYKNNVPLTYLILLYMNSAIFYFVTDNIDESLKWVNKILNYSSHASTERVFFYSRILNLILHYELHNYNYVDNYIKTTYAYLNKKEKLYVFEKLILKWIVKLLNSESVKHTNEIFKEFKDEIINAAQAPFEKQAISEMNILEWLTSKIENKSMREVIEQNLLK